MRIDFYLLNQASPDASGLFICRLLEKAYRQGHRVFVYCKHAEQADHLDELLWTFKPESFIPHHLQGEGPEPPPPIQIGYAREPQGFSDILLNLSDQVPAFYSKFRRVIEVIAADEPSKELGRTHFRFYRDAGIRPQTNDI